MSQYWYTVSENDPYIYIYIYIYIYKPSSLDWNWWRQYWWPQLSWADQGKHCPVSVTYTASVLFGLCLKVKYPGGSFFVQDYLCLSVCVLWEGVWLDVFLCVCVLWEGVWLDVFLCVCVLWEGVWLDVFLCVCVYCGRVCDWMCFHVCMTAWSLTPSLPQPVKFLGWKMDTYTCKQKMFQSNTKYTFNTVRLDGTPFTY